MLASSRAPLCLSYWPSAAISGITVQITRILPDMVQKLVLWVNDNIQHSEFPDFLVNRYINKQINSTNIYSIFHIPETLLGAKNKVMNEIRQVFILMVPKTGKGNIVKFALFDNLADVSHLF